MPFRSLAQPTQPTAQPTQQSQGNGGVLIPEVKGAILVDDYKKKQGLDTQADLAKQQAEQAAKVKDTLYFLNNLPLNGKSYLDVTLDDVVKAMNGNADAAKSFLDLRNAFKQTTQGNDAQKGYLIAAKASLEQLAKLADRIPSGSGLYGRYVQKGINSYEKSTGQLPQKDTFDNFANLTLPLLIKGFGDSGNISDSSIQLALPAIQSLASPQKEVREESKKFLFNMIDAAIGGGSSNATGQQQVQPTSGPKTIRVRDKASGQTGTIPENEFDQKLYDRI